jgi:FKBP-type peptidyl-prolyl cis-trans isomerase FklB
MKRILFPVITAAVLSSALAQTTMDLKETKARSSYAIGADIAKSIKRQPLELDTKALAAGLTDGLEGKLALSEAELSAALASLQQQLQEKARAQQAEAGDKNLKAGEEFLAANGKKEGIKTTKSGLQYQVVKSGSGKTPKATESVKVHYHGTLIDGTVFDSSVERGEPISFPVNGVIPGWTEALQLMKEGDKWKLFIPSALAYGENGAGPKIGPNSVLIFDVELLSVGGAE